MHKKYTAIIGILILIGVQSCSKRTVPAGTAEPAAIKTEIKRDTLVAVNKVDSVAVVAKKPVIKRKPKESIPKVMVVNDQFAKRSVDGRLYYDLQGHRYWRSNKDGKYYLFNKSMLTDKAFQKP